MKMKFLYTLSLIITTLIIGGAVYAEKFYLPITVAVDSPISNPVEPQSMQVLGGNFPVIKDLTGANSPLNATTTTATSSPIEIVGARKASLFFTRPNNGATESGTSAFSVWGSYDDTTYFPFNKLIDNVTNSNSQTLTRVASKSLTGTSTYPTMVSIDLQHDNLSSIRIIVNETTDGWHTAEARIEY